MKQRIIYALDRERKELFENNKAFADRMGQIFADHLKVEYWTDADEDGICGGKDISMDYYSNDDTEWIFLEDNRISVLHYDEERNEKEIELSDEELKIVSLLIQEGEEYAAEEAREAACYAKGPYHYNGVRRSDFY